MKKMILIMALATLGFAGCEKEVVRPQTNECNEIIAKTMVMKADGRTFDYYFLYANGKNEAVYLTTFELYNIGATYCQRPSQRP